MLKVVYPGTFDPFTRGHEDLVRRAARLFDSVVVGVADSEAKRPFFTLRDRVEMAREVLRPYQNVEVLGFSTLLMDFVQEQGAMKRVYFLAIFIECMHVMRSRVVGKWN